MTGVQTCALPICLSALSYSDTPTPFSPEYLYRVIGFNGTQKVAVSAETPVTFTDTDGDGLPDSWEAEWSLNPNTANTSYTWLTGVGLSALQLFIQGANRADYPAISPSDWNGQKRLHAYYYPAAGGGNGIVWEDWEGNAPLTATVQVERENADGTWEPISGATATVAAGFVEWAAGGGPGDNFRLRGGVTSCETLLKVRMMARNTEIQRDHPGFYDSDANRYYLSRDWGTPGEIVDGKNCPLPMAPSIHPQRRSSGMETRPPPIPAHSPRWHPEPSPTRPP